MARTQEKCSCSENRATKISWNSFPRILDANFFVFLVFWRADLFEAQERLLLPLFSVSRILVLWANSDFYSMKFKKIPVFAK